MAEMSLKIGSWRLADGLNAGLEADFPSGPQQAWAELLLGGSRRRAGLGQGAGSRARRVEQAAGLTSTGRAWGVDGPGMLG